MIVKKNKKAESGFDRKKILQPEREVTEKGL